MNKILAISISVFISFLIIGSSTELHTLNQTDYEENLNFASELYLKKKEIPISVLLKLVPKNHDEFGLYYGTTESDNILGETDFFYDTTRLIFE